jgi:hypothetical protein
MVVCLKYAVYMDENSPNEKRRITFISDTYYKFLLFARFLTNDLAKEESYFQQYTFLVSVCFSP